MRKLKMVLLLASALFVSAGYAQPQDNESAEIRKAIAEMNKKAKESEQKEQKQQELEARLREARLQSQTAKAKEEVEQLQKELREAEEETRKTKEELSKLQQRLKELESRIYLRIAPQELHFNSQGGKEKIQVTSNFQNWYVSSFPEWCSAVKDTDSFTVVCEANNDELRTGFLTVSAGDIEMTVHLSQEPNSTALSQGNWRNFIYKAMEKGVIQIDKGTYKGESENNQPRGSGLFLWHTGTIHIGNWGLFSTDQKRIKYGKQGAGVYISPNGFTINNCAECCYLSGNWEKDVRTGYGTCYDTFGNCLYQGNFINDRPIETYPSDKDLSAYKFECIEYKNGDQYVGETKTGKQHGYGMLLYKTGDIWYGKWENGNRSGQGVYLRSAGDVILGN